VTREQFYLAVGAIVTVYIAAMLFSRHLYRCRCGATFQTPDAFDLHLHTAHRYE
jgi:hypothetical protein